MIPAVLDKPSLVFVIGLPIAFLLVTIGIGWLIYVTLGRILHDD